MSSIFDKTAVISSGARLPLRGVSSSLALLGSLLGDEGARPLVADLRRVCLGETIPPDRAAALCEGGLASAESGVRPILRAVVLASVRGTGSDLHLASPFTDRLDLALSDFLIARAHLVAELAHGKAVEALGEDAVGAELAEVRALLGEGAAGAQHAATPEEERVKRVDSIASRCLAALDGGPGITPESSTSKPDPRVEPRTPGARAEPAPPAVGR